MRRRPHVLERQRVQPRHLRVVRAGEQLPLPAPLPTSRSVAAQRPRRRQGAALRGAALGLLALLGSFTLAALIAWACRTWSR